MRRGLVALLLYQDYALVATHRRARPGQRRTLTAHLPPDKVHFLTQTPTWCRTRAAEIGPACGDFIEQLLGERPLDRLRSAQGILRLSQRYSPSRVDAACARALAVGEYRYHTVKTILAHALDGQPLPDLAPGHAPLTHTEEEPDHLTALAHDGRPWVALLGRPLTDVEAKAANGKTAWQVATGEEVMWVLREARGKR